MIAAACPNAPAALQLTAKVACRFPAGLSTLTYLILFIYACVAFGLGATTQPEHVREIIRYKKRAFAVGMLSQFGFMPLMIFALSKAFQLKPLTAIGAILCGCAPGGSTSNMLTYWVSGNVTLSIAMSAASTLASLFMIPLLYELYIKRGLGLSDSIPLPLFSVFSTFLIIVVFVSLGMLVRRYNKTAQCGPKWRRCFYWEFSLKLASIFTLILLVAALVTGILDNPELFKPADFPKEWAIAGIFQPLGALFGYIVSRLTGLDIRDAKTVCLETGVQSYPMVLAIIGLTWTGCDATIIRSFPLIATFWYVLSTAWMIPAIQLLTIRDSCLERCFGRKPPIISMHLPKSQSVEAAKALAAGEGKPRTLTSSPLPVESKCGEGISDCYSMFARAARLHPTNYCLGKRSLDAKGNFGPYRYLTYKTVHTQVLDLASGVAALKLPSKSAFGMYSVNCIEFQVATLGMMSQGHTCVPVYDTLGEDIIQYEVNHAEIAIMFVENKKLGKLANVIAQCAALKHVVLLSPTSEEDEASMEKLKAAGVAVTDFPSLLAAGASSPVEPKPASGTDLAFIMYTSGTTGDPKGVCITQRAITVGSSWCAGIELLETDRYLSYLPLAHIFETMVEHALLSVGASIGFYTGDVRKLQQDILALKPTVFAGVPRVYQRFYESANSKIAMFPGCLKSLFSHALKTEMQSVAGPDGKRSAWGKFLAMTLGGQVTGGKVRIMISGAAPLPQHVHEFLVAAIGCDVLQGYGMTENCANATIALLGDNRAGHVGPPMPTMEIKLVDVPEMEYTSAGNQSGEVCTRGVCNFVGYHKNKEETDKVLEADGWLHTGDIGRWNPDGTLSIVDRKKNIFKLSQGEYVAAEKVEMIVSKSKYVAQPWIYGNSNYSCLVAVVTPDWAELAKAAAENGWAADAKADASTLAAKPEVQTFILDEMVREGKEAKLKPFELPKAVRLEPTINELMQGFSIANDCLTPTFKLKRPQLLKRYKEAIDEMYRALGEVPSP